MRANGKLFATVPILFFLGFWEIASIFFDSNDVPSILRILETFFSTFWHDPIIKSQGGGDHGYYPHVLATFISSATATTIGLICGLLLAFGTAHFSVLEKFFVPIIESFRVIPPLIFIPFILILIGPSEYSPILVGAVYSAFSLYIYSANAIENVPKQYRTVGRVYRANTYNVIKTIEFPAIMPEVLSGLRMTFAITLGIIVVTEYLGAPNGIGRVLKYAISFSNVELIIVGILWASILGVIGNLFIGLISPRRDNRIRSDSFGFK